MGEVSIAEEEDASMSNIYMALAHSTRQGILRLLGQNRAFSFSDLMEKLNVKDSSTLTHHLKKLEGLVDRLADGKYVLTDLGHMAYNILRRGDLYAKAYSSDVQKELHERSLRNPLITFPLILVAFYFPLILLTYLTGPQIPSSVLFSAFFSILASRIGFFVAGCYLVYWGLKHILPEFGFSKQLALYITFTLFGLIWLFSLI